MKKMEFATSGYIGNRIYEAIIFSGFLLLQCFFWNSLYRIYRLGFLLQDGLYGARFGIIETLGLTPGLILGILFFLSFVFILIGSRYKNGRYLSVTTIICLILQTILILIVISNILSPIDRTTFSLS